MEKTICELFAGVGGFRLGFERLNSGWETTWFSQWEPAIKSQYAHECYVKHFGDCVDLNGEYHTNEDISTVNKHIIPNHTLLVGGFPCQDYSVAQSLSTSKGIEGKKGVLWWEIKDTLDVKRPPFCILENVDRLLASPAYQRGRDFGIILSSFYELGYSVEWRVVNAARYGAAQKRRRTFIFAYHDDTLYSQKIKKVDATDVVIKDGFMVQAFPIKEAKRFTNTIITSDILNISDTFSFNFENAGYMRDGLVYTTKVIEDKESPIPLGDILECNVDEVYYVLEDKIPKFEYLKGQKTIPRISKTGFAYTFSEGAIPFPDRLDKPSRTMLTSEATMNRSTHIIEDPETKRLRVLTPIETERLQGFDDDWTNSGMPIRARYMCMGNALVVPMITRMGKILDKIIDEE